jgi:hypothetical protein
VFLRGASAGLTAGTCLPRAGAEHLQPLRTARSKEKSQWRGEADARPFRHCMISLRAPVRATPAPRASAPASASQGSEYVQADRAPVDAVSVSQPTLDEPAPAVPPPRAERHSRNERYSDGEATDGGPRRLRLLLRLTPRLLLLQTNKVGPKLRVRHQKVLSA